jgi:colanic acid biosynthesis glycosyl transferase WcaI
MRFLIHDFAGHPFQVQLSRELAARGHSVTHLYPSGLDGPKGRLERSETDPEGLTICGLPLSSSFRKYSPWRRFVAQYQYARDVKQLIGTDRFDVVLSGNTPIDIQAQLLWHCRKHQIGFVHWVQDVYCRAIEFFLRRRIGPLAALLTFPFTKLEQMVAARSQAAIVIAPAFRELLRQWGVPAENISVLENWAPLDEIAPLRRSNDWSTRQGLNGKTVFLYSGTLGLKHRPDLLYKLAAALDDDCRVVVISEGTGRQYLESMPKLNNLTLLGFQPYDQVPNVLASADVLLATLEADAGEFAVPSKILTYLCAGRPLLLAAPASNLAASVVQRSGAGFVADPDSPHEWIGKAVQLAASADLRGSLGVQARRYAEENFDIARIASAFEEVLYKAYPAGLATSAATEIQTEP